MTKQELIQYIEANVVRIINAPEVLPADHQKNINAAGITTYNVNALVEQQDGTAKAENFFFYVVDEGTADEKAFPMEKFDFTPTTLRDEALAYIEHLENSGTFERVTVDQVKTDKEYILATALEKQSDGTLHEKRIALYKEGDTPVYREVTTTVS